MYQFVGKTAPFLILACLALGDGCNIINKFHFICTHLMMINLHSFIYYVEVVLQLLVLQPAIAHQEEDPVIN